MQGERWLAPGAPVLPALRLILALEAALCDRGNVQPGGPGPAAVQLLLRGHEV